MGLGSGLGLGFRCLRIDADECKSLSTRPFRRSIESAAGPTRGEDTGEPSGESRPVAMCSEARELLREKVPPLNEDRDEERERPVGVDSRQ